MSKKNKKKNKARQPGTKSPQPLFIDGPGDGPWVEWEGPEALCQRTGVSIDEIKSITTDESKEEFERTEKFRQYLALISPVAFNEDGQFIVNLEDPLDGHLALLLHQRERITLYFGTSLI